MKNHRLDIENIITFLFNPNVDTKEKSKVSRIILDADNRVLTIDDLEFWEHPNRTLDSELLEETLVFFPNGYGVNITKLDNKEYPYHILRIRRDRFEFTEHCNLKKYDIRCKNKGEVNKELAKLQKRLRYRSGLQVIRNILNYLDTLEVTMKGK